MGNHPRIHLAHRHNSEGETITACGVIASRVSRDPKAVTCGACRRTLAMADAEARQSMKQPRRFSQLKKNRSARQ